MQGSLSYFLSAVAFFAALGIFLYGMRRRAQLTDDLQPVIASLADGRGILSEAASPTEFYANLDDIGSRLQALPVVGAAWSEFARSLIRDPDLELALATRPASQFFNSKLPYHPEVGLRAHEATPNQLVGIGLFCTFVGLFLSLVIASSGMSGDINEAKDSLVALLSASAVKFLTSIAAIAAALLFTRRKHQLLASVDQLVGQFSHDLDRLTASTNAEAIAMKNLGQLRLQSNLLENSNVELAKTIAAELNATLQVSLKDAIAPVAQEINGMALRLGEINETAMRYMVDRFTKELGGAAREHSQQMAALLDQVARAVQGVPEAIAAATDRFTTAIDGSLDDIRETFSDADSRLASSLSGAAQGVMDSSNALKAVSDQLGAVSASLAETERGIEERLERVSETTSASIRSLSDIAERLEQMSAQLPDLSEVANQIGSAASAIQQGGQAIESLGTRSLETQEAAAKNAERLATAAQDLSTGINSLDEALAGVLTKLTGGLESFTTQANKILHDTDLTLAKTVDKLQETIAQLGRSKAGRQPK